MHQLIAEAVAEKRALIAVSGFRPLPGAVNAVKRFARTSKLAVVTGASTAEAHRRAGGNRRPRLHGGAGGRRGLHARQAGARAVRPGDRAPGRRCAQSIAIEDATPGILSARAAGARVIAVRAGNFAGYDLSPADVVVDTLDEVTDDALARLLP